MACKQVCWPEDVKARWLDTNETDETDETDAEGGGGVNSSSVGS